MQFEQFLSILFDLDNSKTANYIKLLERRKYYVFFKCLSRRISCRLRQNLLLERPRRSFKWHSQFSVRQCVSRHQFLKKVYHAPARIPKCEIPYPASCSNPSRIPPCVIYHPFSERFIEFTFDPPQCETPYGKQNFFLIFWLFFLNHLYAKGSPHCRGSIL